MAGLAGTWVGWHGKDVGLQRDIARPKGGSPSLPLFGCGQVPARLLTGPTPTWCASFIGLTKVELRPRVVTGGMALEKKKGPSDSVSASS